MGEEEEAIDGTAGEGGASDEESPEGGGQSSETEGGKPEGAPAGEGLFDGMTPEALHKSYKSLQGEFTKRSETLKDLEKNFSSFGGFENVLKYSKYLSDNPRFKTWLEEEKKISIAGEERASDPEFQKAISIVNKLIDDRLSSALNRDVKPYTEAFAKERLTKTFAKMDEQYEGWKDVSDLMADIGEATFPQEVLDNPSYDVLETLYFRALSKSGKLNDVMAKSYEKKLQKIKKLGSGQAGVTPKGKKAAGSLREAFEMAKAG